MQLQLQQDSHKTHYICLQYLTLNTLFLSQNLLTTPIRISFYPCKLTLTLPNVDYNQPHALNDYVR
jgi:hypothetical protein